jgi:hypothetical protein
VAKSKTPYFPQHTVQFSAADAHAYRRFSFSLVEMALVTGVVFRIFRVLVLTQGSNIWIYLGGIALGLFFIIGMVTAHLANYPLHHYLWRAPLFAAVAVAGEMATSLALIAAGVEPIGTMRAHYGEWPAMAAWALLLRGGLIVFWAAALAAGVHLAKTRMKISDA